MNNFNEYVYGVLQTLNAKNILDIVILAAIFYKIISIVKNTRAEQLLKGFIAIFIVMKISSFFGLIALTWLIQSTLNFGVIAFIVIFQPEFRKILEKLGSSATINKKGCSIQELVLQEILTAISVMAQSKTGALIVIEKNENLNEYCENATIINSEVLTPLLLNIFSDGTPLHDGAVIIREGRIFATNAVLPLTNKELSLQHGTRHRAGVGITEVSDCTSIIVSEETGKISICYKGDMIADKNGNEIIDLLKCNLGIDHSIENERWWGSWKLKLGKKLK